VATTLVKASFIFVGSYFRIDNAVLDIFGQPNPNHKCQIGVINKLVDNIIPNLLKLYFSTFSI